MSKKSGALGNNKVINRMDVQHDPSAITIF